MALDFFQKKLRCTCNRHVKRRFKLTDFVFTQWLALNALYKVGSQTGLTSRDFSRVSPNCSATADKSTLERAANTLGHLLSVCELIFPVM